MENFIQKYQIEDESIIDSLVNLYERSPKTPGVLISGDGTSRIDKSVKDSTNFNIEVPTTLPEVISYFSELKKAADLYNKIYSYSNIRWGITETFTIQKYQPGGAYFDWHFERVGPKYPNVARYLVFMTYLNDVTDHGETEFYYQKIKVSPKKGLTLIWPAEWTHTHRGIPSPTQEKIIISGWLNLI